VDVPAGRVIHEFDPWFNFRATEYLVDHGWDKFQVCLVDPDAFPLCVCHASRPERMICACGFLGLV
jgi:hypothetical protein